MAGIKYLGFMVVPTDLEGKSPFDVEFKVTGSLLVKRYKVDFKDDSTAEGSFEQEGEYMVAYIKHTYTYVKGSRKYTGKSFYPEFTIYGVDEMGNEIYNVFNTAKTGRSLAIVVQA